ncbi:MAG: ABC transporter permease [Propionibacteriaceae bacterium]|jgi:ABC-2 type transport system permease protein|nr:ABC transporter permease [Propionibacteriaceae bacterium]
MGRHNLRTVISFEVKRTLTKPLFWVAALVVPVLAVAAMVLSTLSQESAREGAGNPELQDIAFVFTDESGLVSPEVATSMNGTKIADSQQGLADVKAGTVDAYFAFGADLLNEPVQIHGVDIGLFGNSGYESLAATLIQSSLVAQVDNPEVAELLLKGPTFDVTTYQDGQDGKKGGGSGAMMLGIMFLLVFYLLIVTLSNRMLSSTLEEKENRVTEMILTTIDASNLLIGKIVSLTIIGIIQMAVIMVPIFVLARLFPNVLPEGLSLEQLEFDPQIIIVGTLMLVCGFVLFTVSLVAVGAAMPTVKDAQGVFTALILAVMVPMFVITQIMASPDSIVVQALTYFPYFAPMTGMLRNAMGNLPLWQAGISLALMLAVSYFMFRLAIRLFRYGSVEYSKKIDIRSALRSG